MIINGTWQDELPKLPSESVDLIIIDPPYLTTGEKWDKQEQVTATLSQELFRVAKPSCSLYVWCGIGEKSQSLIRWFPLFSEWHFKDLITWKKQRGIGMRKGWLYTREELLWYVKDNSKFVWNESEQYSDERRKNPVGFNGNPTKNECKRFTDVWIDVVEESFNTSERELSSDKKKHFTPKPIKAIERIIKAHTQEGDTVLDCFLGSGTTIVACANLNRNGVGIEKEKEYCDIAQSRINNTRLL